VRWSKEKTSLKGCISHELGCYELGCHGYNDVRPWTRVDGKEKFLADAVRILRVSAKGVVAQAPAHKGILY
jgi:hypothetical protein